MFDETNGLFGLSYVRVWMCGERPGEIVISLGVIGVELECEAVMSYSLVNFALGEEDVAEVAVSNPGVGVFLEGVEPEGFGVFVDVALLPGDGCEGNEDEYNQENGSEMEWFWRKYEIFAHIIMLTQGGV